jgi:hypothetical protein
MPSPAEIPIFWNRLATEGPGLPAVNVTMEIRSRPEPLTRSLPVGARTGRGSEHLSDARPLQPAKARTGPLRTPVPGKTPLDRLPGVHASLEPQGTDLRSGDAIA